MSARYKVILQGDNGVFIFDNKKVVFPHKNKSNTVKKGLGVVVEGTLVDKGKFAFADIINVVSVVPNKYHSLDFFENRGVPRRIFKGYYGNSVLLKEEYADKSFIKAYNRDGDTVLYENKIISNQNYTGDNMYYHRLDKVVCGWEDITSEVVGSVLKDIHRKVCVVDTESEVFTKVVKGIAPKSVLRTGKGVIAVRGNYESIVLWSDSSKVIKMAWFGRILGESDLVCDGVEPEDISSSLIK